MKHNFFLVVIFSLFSSALIFSEETENTAVGKTDSDAAVTAADSDNPGMEFLDQATEAKLRASAVSDLSQVIILCQRAKKTGLAGENLEYCNQLLASTQIQRGLFLAQTLLTPQATRQRDWFAIRQRALVDLEEAVAVVKDQPTPFLRIAQLNLMPDGDESRAKEALKSALQCSEDEPGLQMQAIRMLSLLEPAPEEREKILAEAAQNGIPEIKLLHALTLDELNREDEALAVLKKLIDEESGNYELHERIISAVSGLGKNETAMQILDLLLEKASGERKDLLLLNKAELLFKTDQNKEALELLSSLEEKFQENRNAHLDLLVLRSGVYFDMEDYEKSQQSLSEAEKLRPGFPPVLYQRYMVFAAQKKFEEALEVAKQLQAIEPGDRGNLLREIQALSELKRYEDAVKIAERLRNQSPDESQWSVLLIELYLKQNSYDKAAELTEEQLKEHPEDLRWIAFKSQILSEQEKWDEAVAWIESCISANSDLRELNLLLVGILAESKQYEAAKKRIEPLLTKDPDNQFLLRADSQISISLGLHGDAIKTLKKVIEQDPEDYTSINNLSWIFSTSPIDSVRNGKEALELAIKACELTQYNKAFIVSTLAAAYAELGDFEKAMEWSQKSIDLAENETDYSEEEKKELLDNLRKELETFQKDQPFRELIESDKDN